MCETLKKLQSFLSIWNVSKTSRKIPPSLVTPIEQILFRQVFLYKFLTPCQLFTLQFGLKTLNKSKKLDKSSAPRGSFNCLCSKPPASKTSIKQCLRGTLASKFPKSSSKNNFLKKRKKMNLKNETSFKFSGSKRMLPD